MRIAVTGANGFIGGAIVRQLILSGHQAVALVRNATHHFPKAVKQIEIGDLSQLDESRLTSVFQSIKGFDAIIHTAALAHKKDMRADYANQVDKVNVQATALLAQLASQFEIGRFIFLSSIGVNGSVSTQAFIEQGPPNPHNLYSKCKYQAEQRLLSLASQSDLEVVIVRPPLVYALDAPGNFAKLIKLIKTTLPLPFKNTNNQRSFIALDNLVDFLLLCADEKSTPLAKNQVFLIADDQSISTEQLTRNIAGALGVKLHLVYINHKILLFFLSLVNKKQLYTQLFESLTIDNSKAKAMLNWQPKTTMEQQLNKHSVD